MARVIKRYENRKLYDTEERRYISLEELAALIRRGVDVQVIDRATDEDITTQTLTQIILEEGKKGRNPFSKEMLHDIIRWGSSVLDDSLKQVREGLDQLVPEPITRLFSRKEAEEIDELKQRVAQLEELIRSLAQQQSSGGEKQNTSSGEKE